MDPIFEQMSSMDYRNRSINPIVMINERWIQICTFEENIQDRYWISDYGNIYDSKYNALVYPVFKDNGYLYITLECINYKNHNQHSKPYPIHRLVAMAFIGIPENYRELHVNHKDTVRHNNYYMNLEWMTPKENVAYSFAQGTRGIGENSNRNVYPESVVRQICMLFEQGIYDYETICMTVLGEHVTEALKTFIYGIGKKLFWTSVSCDYNFEGIKDREYFFTLEQVHAICKFYEDNKALSKPGTKGSTTRIIKEIFGLDPEYMDNNLLAKYRNNINSIKRKLAYRYIYLVCMIFKKVQRLVSNHVEP